MNCIEIKLSPTDLNMAKARIEAMKVAFGENIKEVQITIHGPWKDKNGEEVFTGKKGMAVQGIGTKWITASVGGRPVPLQALKMPEETLALIGAEIQVQVFLHRSVSPSLF